MKCELEGCDNQARSKDGGLCNKHRLQVDRYGGIKRTKYDPNQIIECGKSVYMHLYDAKGKYAASTIVDANIVDRLRGLKWYMNKAGYVVTGAYPYHRFLHHVVFGKRILMDHINRNPLDNRRSNLRPATKSQNAMNSKLRSDNRSGYRGVSFDKRAKRWRAYVSSEGTRRELGLFDTKEEAAMVRNIAAIKFHGEYARLNSVWMG